jgi:hypothetical protein
MKRIAIVGAVLGGAGCVCVLAGTLGGLYKDPLPPVAMPWWGNAQTGTLSIPFHGSNLLPQAGVSATNKPPLRILINPQAARTNTPFAAPVPPGVYKTFPYTCIVVVPGPHPDDASVVKPGNVDPSMPIVKPDLQFIPWSPAK